MYEYRGTVLNVVDGDTVDINVDLGFKLSAVQRMRIAHIDTPERGQTGFKEAGDALRSLILNKQVTVRTEKVSKWGYYLANLMIGEVNVSEYMLTNKLAKPYEGGTKE